MFPRRWRGYAGSHALLRALASYDGTDSNNTFKTITLGGAELALLSAIPNAVIGSKATGRISLPGERFTLPVTNGKKRLSDTEGIVYLN